MDDSQNQQQPVNQPAADVAAADALSSMNDVAGMTPPPAPVMPTDPAPVAPSMSAPAASAEPAVDDDYSSAETILNEILDGLDRIEAKLEAMEKKMG